MEEGKIVLYCGYYSTTITILNYDIEAQSLYIHSFIENACNDIKKGISSISFIKFMNESE
jgi:hypothetical protein